MGKYSLAYSINPWLNRVVQSQSAPWLNRFVASAPEPTLLASCFSALARETLGTLSALPESTRQSWAEYIAAQQSPENGIFRDPLFQETDLSGKVHGVEYILWQFTFFSAAALHALGARPKYPLHFLDDVLAKNPVIEDWLAGLDWADPWLVSNQIMFFASFLIQEAERYDNARYRDLIDRIFNWLDATQNPETGFWDLGRGAKPHYAMAGAFHFYFLYFYLGRPVRYAEKIIDNTLALQHADGLYSPAGGGGACLDLDAIDILVKFSLLVDYRATEIKASLERSFISLLKNQNPDGGFCEAKRPDLWAKTRKRRLMELLGIDRLLNRPWRGRPVQHLYYSGWNKMRQQVDESDLWSAWFRPLALGLISTRYPGEFIDDIDWQFHASPALGWHDLEKLQDLRQAYYDAVQPEDGMQAGKPLISVVMAVHNGEPYLREAVDSILSQTYPNFEFIIVDDASTDGSAQTLDSYTDERIIRIKNEANLGLPASLNVGLNAARGSLIARQDADDISHPDRFRQQVNFLAAHPAVSLISTDYRIIDIQGRVLENVILPTTNHLLQKRLENGNIFVHSNIVVRRKVLDQVGGYREYFRMTQDYDLFLRIAECSEIANIPVLLHSVRIHPGSGSRRKHELQIAYKQLAWRLAHQRRSGLPESPLPDDLLAEYPPDHSRLFVDARGVAFLYYSAGIFDAAEEKIKQARDYEPAISDPAASWKDWTIDRAHRVSAACHDITAGLSYINWITGVLERSGLKLSKRQLTARFYADQAFLAFGSAPNQNSVMFARKAITLDPKWAGNRGLLKILLNR